MKLYVSLIKNQFLYLLWLFNGKPFPPHAIFKRRRLAKIGKKYNCDTIIETGTADGKTMLYLRNYFKLLMSVEIFRPNYEIAKKRLSKFSNIKLFYGDSGVLLEEISSKIIGRCLYWLDGHYSGGNTGKSELDTPIAKELKQIAKLQRKDHIILIDDASLFIGKNGYPTREKLEEIIYSINPEYNIKIDMDCIIVTI